MFASTESLTLLVYEDISGHFREKLHIFFKLWAMKFNLPVSKIFKQVGTHKGQKREDNLRRLKE